MPKATPVVAATVVVRPEVLRSIRRACEGAGNCETGGPLIGTVQRSWEPDGERLIVAVLGTVLPGPAVEERLSSVSLGSHNDGERAASALRWWRSATELELVHLGDWHLHPSGRAEPSAGDAHTAGWIYRETDKPVWLTAVAAGSTRRQESLETKAHVARLRSEGGSSLDVAFYRAVGRPQLAAIPITVESAAVPRLPALPWHVADPLRFAVECRLLAAAGFKTAIASDGEAGLALRISRNGTAVTAITGSAYPLEAPKLVDHRPLGVRGWAQDRFLVDLVREVC